MYFFSLWKWDHFRFSLKIMCFNNISWLTHVPCVFCFQQDEISLEVLPAYWISRIFHHWAMWDVVFLFIKMISFYNFSEDDEFEQCFIIDQRPLYFFISWKWDHFRIFLSMMNFSNISSLVKLGCAFCFHENDISLEFLWGCWISTIFHVSPMSNVLFLFMKMRLSQNFSEDEFEQYFIIYRPLM